MSLEHLRNLYVYSAIEAEEFEGRLDALLTVDPDALNHETWWLPVTTVNSDAVLRSVYGLDCR